MENSTTQRRDAFDTEYTIRGTEEYIDERIAHLMREYHPAGYGTVVKARGLGWAQVVRSNSCD